MKELGVVSWKLLQREKRIANIFAKFSPQQKQQRLQYLSRVIGAQGETYFIDYCDVVKRWFI